MSDVKIRKARVEDSSIILGFIKELAAYEKEPEAVTATVADIEHNLFDARTTTDAVICSLDGRPIGFAVYFLNFSTWLGKNGLFLEDLYITPEFRNCGAGKIIIKYLAEKAVELGCGRFEWSVLDWNEPAIKFYESIGAEPLSEWTTYRLTGSRLIEFAKG